MLIVLHAADLVIHGGNEPKMMDIDVLFVEMCIRKSDFCEKHKSDNEKINSLAVAAQKRIRATQKQGPRINVPTSVEIEAVRHGDPVAIRVQKLDNTSVTVPAHSWTTVKELSNMVTHKLGLKDGEPFAIFEVSSDEEERVLDEDERVLDIIAYWQKTYAHTNTYT